MFALALIWKSSSTLLTTLNTSHDPHLYQYQYWKLGHLDVILLTKTQLGNRQVSRYNVTFLGQIKQNAICVHVEIPVNISLFAWLDVFLFFTKSYWSGTVHFFYTILQIFSGLPFTGYGYTKLNLSCTNFDTLQTWIYLCRIWSDRETETCYN